MISYQKYGIIHDIIYIRSDIIDSNVIITMISYKIYDIIIKIMISHTISCMIKCIISDTRSMISCVNYMIS